MPPIPECGGSLYVMVVEAHDLTGKDFSGLSDPYVKLHLGDQETRSEIMFQTLDPHWFEKFKIEVKDSEHAFLRVEVWDYDWGKPDDFLGQLEMPLYVR